MFCFCFVCFSSADIRIMWHCVEKDVSFVSTQECKKGAIGSLLKMQLSVYIRKRKPNVPLTGKRLLASS